LVFAALFTYAELIDKATYLNHYYFVSLIALLLAFVPSSSVWSVDARRTRRASTVSFGNYLLLRAQVAIVYLCAGVAKLDALLLHRPSDLTGPRGPEYLRALGEREITDRGGALGISIYDPAELDRIWPVWRPQLVQAPFSVIDRRLSASGWLAKLAENGVRVHARSVFLQGLLLMPMEQRPAWFQPWTPLLDRWLAWCTSNSVSPQLAALSFVDKQVAIERYVVGVDSVPQFEELLSLDLENCPPIPEEFSCDDRLLVEPSRWKLQ
jgi:hypothetical protein